MLVPLVTTRLFVNNNYYTTETKHGVSTLMMYPVAVVVTMTVCSSTRVLTSDVSCVNKNVLTGDDSNDMLPTSGLLGVENADDD